MKLQFLATGFMFFCIVCCQSEPPKDSEENTGDYDGEDFELDFARFRAKEMGVVIFQQSGIEIIVFPREMFGWENIKDLLNQRPGYISNKEIDINKLASTDPDEKLISDHLDEAIDLIAEKEPSFSFDPERYVVQTLVLQNTDEDSKAILYNFIKKEYNQASFYGNGDFIRSSDIEMNIRVFVKTELSV